MFELFYNFYGLNQEIFLLINRSTNVGLLPYVLKILSSCFNISSFAIIYVLYCKYFYFNLKKNKNLIEPKLTTQDVIASEAEGQTWESSLKQATQTRRFCLFNVFSGLPRRVFGTLRNDVIGDNERNNLFWPTYNKLVEIGITYTLFGCLFALLKFTVNMPRPFCSLPSANFVTIANISSERCLSSFPSSHTGLSLLICYFFWSYVKLPNKILLSLVAMFVTISRITLAMHYPADIIYSCLITIITIWIGKKIFKIFSGNLIKHVGNIILKL